MSERCEQCGEVPNPDGLCACPVSVSGNLTSKDNALLKMSDRDKASLAEDLERLNTFTKWRPIETLDKSKYNFVIVTQDGMIRLRLWDYYHQQWEHQSGGKVLSNEECANPTHWMPCPDCPAAVEAGRKQELYACGDCDPCLGGRKDQCLYRVKL